MTISAAALRALLRYDLISGVFTWRVGHREGRIAGGQNRKGYWRICISGRYYQAHRLAWLYVTGKWPHGEIDHIDCDKLNNRFVNLREASSAENKWNTLKKPGTYSAFKGVTLHRTGRWQASIRSNGRNYHLGLFSDEAEAHAAYCKAAAAQHGVFARAA